MAKTNYSDPTTRNNIAPGTSITGDVVSDGDIRFDGNLTGNLRTKGKLVVGPSGTIKGEVVCKNADISGALEGKITVEELLSLKSTAKLMGDIKNTNKLTIEPGAVFTGTCNMGSSGQSYTPQNAGTKEKDKPEEKATK